MRKEVWTTTLSTAFAVALTVTPGIQLWLALPAWGVTVWAGWRWYSHSQTDALPRKFEGKFFPAPAVPPAKPPRGEKPDWLDVQIVTMTVSLGLPGETSVNMQLRMTNRNTASVAKLKFFLADSEVTKDTRQLAIIAAAPKYEVMRRPIPDTPGLSPVLYPPVTVPVGQKEGGLWFFYQAPRQHLPFASLVIEDIRSGAIWSVQIDPRFSKQVADNPTLSLMWPGPDLPTVVFKDGQIYRLP